VSRRRLGQHFLTDVEIIRRIVDSAELEPLDRVFEIGPGKGAITLPLVEKGVLVTSLELDEDLAEALIADAPEGLHVIKGDALVADFPELVGDGDRSGSVLVANLPYRITGALLQRILEAGCWSRAVLMVQREVALRLAAEVGTKDYSILTVAANLRSSVEYLFSVPAGCFDPPPKVVSAVVRFRFKDDRIPVQDEKLFFRVVRAAFQQRRKMLRNSLSTVLEGHVEAVLESAEIDPSLRPESVSVDGFERICRSFDAVTTS
jgi:16S rRNA (adenine1518-N6/adenine1519-N6)-dimethyltransferase